MGGIARYLAEFTRALGVLGVLLFVVSPGVSPDLLPSYGQVGASPAVAVSILKSKLAPLCGGGWGDDQLCHAPCHACRTGLPALPPPPVVAEAAFRSGVSIRYAVATRTGPRARPAVPARSRGPPVA